MTTTARSPFGPRRHPLDDVRPTPTLSPRPPATCRIVRGARPHGDVVPLAPGEWLVTDRWVPAGPNRRAGTLRTGADEDPAPAGHDDDARRAVGLEHGLCAIRLSGGLARPLIASGTAIDVDPGGFPVGASAVTAWHGIYAVLRVVDGEQDGAGRDAIDMYVYRSYAACVWELLADVEQRLGGSADADRGVAGRDTDDVAGVSGRDTR